MDLPSPSILREIRQNGGITLARFMELALYEPGAGYYERPANRVGKHGDYYTSVSVGPLFGELLGAQLAAWLMEDETTGRMESGHAAPLQVVEAGAHDGRLALDILTWLSRERPALFPRIHYCLLEPSRTRRQWQQETLAPFAARVRWAADWTELGAVTGVLFSNELLDAMPVHRLVWSRRERCWREAIVVELAGELAWSTAPLSPWPLGADHLANLPEALLELLPDGFATEVSPAAIVWWTEAARSLERGRLLALDYGLEALELLDPGRAAGTLRAYRQHQLADNVLANPGEQDLTAQVNFTAIRTAGETAGLRTEGCDSQTRFLSRVATGLWPGRTEALWTPARVRQFQTLTHPQHLGHSFRVLVQQRTR